MANISKVLNVSRPRMLSGKLMMLLLILLAVCVFSGRLQAETSVYVFDSGQSIVVKTGGFAGVHETYAVAGQFRLLVDSNTVIASFEIVDANLTDETGAEYGRSLEEIFNITELSGTVVDDTTIEFEGKTADGTESDVSLKLSFGKGPAQLTGKTTPPSNSADMFFYDVNAVAIKKYAGGIGEPNNPYLIYTAEHLNEMSAKSNDWDKHFKLMADIDLSGYEYDRAVIAPDTGGDGYTFPGTPFTGVFYGNGHAVLNLTITGKSYLGLFGQVGHGGQVRDLGVVDVNITGSYYAIGGLVGDNLQGSINASYSTGDVKGYTFVGGLVGYNNYGDISASFSTCAVGASLSSNQNIGGLVGLNAGCITTSYSTGAVSGQRRIGGLVGRTTDLVAMCYSTGPVSGNEMVGGLVGVRDPNLGIITDCFWDVQTSGQTISAGGTSKTTVEMQMAGTFLDAGWDFADETANGTEDIWWIFEGQDYPKLSWEWVLADDFENGEALPLWQNYEPDSERIRVEETNGRLEVRADDTADDIVAGYVSSGWRLDVTRDFALRIDFHFGKQTIGDGWVLLLLLPSLEEPIDRYVEIEAGCIDNQPFYLYEEVDGAFMQEVSTSRNVDDGKLYISYDADKDEVYLSYTGYGKANAWQTVNGYLQNRWAAEPVYVAIGGGSDRVILDVGDAYLDNFVIDSGLLDFPAVPDNAGIEEP